MNDALSPDANIRHRPLLLEEIQRVGINVYMQHKGTEITESGIICEDKNGKTVKIEGSTVLLALGQRPRRNVVENLLDSAPIVKMIGDCVRPSTITTAVYQGHHAALNI